MRWQRVEAMARKEVIQILRDWRSLVIVLVLPIVMTLLFGYSISLDIQHVKTCVLNRDGGQPSWDLVRRFQASDYFDVTRAVESYAELGAGIDDGSCQLGLILPHDFSRQLHRGGVVTVQSLVDATDDNTATLAMGYAEAVVREFSGEILLRFLGRQGGSATPLPLTIEARTWFNEELKSQTFIIPSIVALVMAVVGTFLTALTVAREWERGTMEQLISTPVTPHEILLGKLAPYFVIGLFDTALCAGVGVWWFGVPFRGSVFTLFAASSLFLVVVLGIGFYLSAAMKTQMAASQASLVATFLPAFLLSGFLFAIEEMPVAIRAITHVVPARYFVTVLKGVFLKGSDLQTLSYEMTALSIFALLVAALATRAIKKKLT